MSVSFPQFKLGGILLEFVKSFKYLGHIITATLADDLDIQREIRNMFTRTNILARRFAKCYTDVKIIMRPSSVGGGRILRRTLSVRLSVCLSVRPSRACLH